MPQFSEQETRQIRRSCETGDAQVVRNESPALRAASNAYYPQSDKSGAMYYGEHKGRQWCILIPFKYPTPPEESY